VGDTLTYGMLFRGMIYTRLAHASKEKHALFDQMTTHPFGLAHVKDRLKQGDGVFESGLGNRYFGFVWACLTLTIVVKTSSSAAAVWKTSVLSRETAGCANP